MALTPWNLKSLRTHTSIMGLPVELITLALICGLAAMLVMATLSPSAASLSGKPSPHESTAFPTTMPISEDAAGREAPASPPVQSYSGKSLESPVANNAAWPMPTSWILLLR